MIGTHVEARFARRSPRRFSPKSRYIIAPKKGIIKMTTNQAKVTDTACLRIMVRRDKPMRIIRSAIKMEIVIIQLISFINWGGVGRYDCLLQLSDSMVHYR